MPIIIMFGSFLPSLWSSINHSLLGSRSRHCYEIIWVLKPTCPVSALIRHYTPEVVDKRSKYRPSPMRRAVQKEKYQRDKRLSVLAAWGPSIQSRSFQSSYPQREPPPRWHFHRLHLHPKR